MTPQSHLNSKTSSQILNRILANTHETHKRKASHKYPMVKPLLNSPPRVAPMDKPWITNDLKPLDMISLPKYPNMMLHRINEWLFQFSGENFTERHFTTQYMRDV